jgi:hypothetical protein
MKFTIDATNDKKVILQPIFTIGFSMDAVSDLFGTTEYQSFFFNQAFHVNDFGISLNFKFRFRFNIEKTVFYDKDWYVKDDPLKTAFAYLDKIEYIRYGNPDLPFYFTTGKIPVTTFGTGFVLNDFHNRTFLPVVRENGLYFRYDGEKFEKYKFNNNPFRFTFLITDLLDPDIMASDFSVDFFKLAGLKGYELSGGISSVFDFNSTEKNRVSSPDQNLDKGNYRNIASNGFTTGLLVFSLPLKFVWERTYYKLTAFHELAFLFDAQNTVNAGFRFGWGDNIGAEMRFINIKGSGFLLGITNSFMIQSSNCAINYFSSNYEIVRYKQYLDLKEGYLFYIMTGISLYAMSDYLQFHLKVSIPVNVPIFTAKISAKFVVEKLFFPNSAKLPDLYIGVFFETGVNPYRFSTTENLDWNIYAKSVNAEYFIDSLTRDFRFSFELGFKYLGTKLGITIGIQRPQSLNLYDQYGIERVKILNSRYNKYNEELEKFISLEAAFVL